MRLKGSGKIVAGLALAAGFALTGAADVSAQEEQGRQGGGARADRQWGHRDGGRRGPFGRFGAELDLTDAQQEQLRQIAERYRESFRARDGERGRRQEREESDPLAGGPFDEAAVRRAAQARADAHVEREVAHARMTYEMYNVLTAEQKAQLAAARQQRRQRRQEFRSRRGARQGQTQLQ